MITQKHATKDAAVAQATCEVEEKESKRKAAIKEKERATSEMAKNQSEPTSSAASKSKDEDDDSPSDADSSKSTVLDNDAMTIGGNDDDNFDLTSEQKSLVNFHNLDHTDELIEHQGSRAAEGAPEGTSPVEEVLMGDEDDGIEIIGVRQEVRGISDNSVGKEESAKECRRSTTSW